MTSKKVENPPIPKDLGVKIGSKLEAFWTQVRDEAEKGVLNAEHTLLLQREVVAIAKRNTLIEREKFKKS